MNRAKLQINPRIHSNPCDLKTTETNEHNPLPTSCNQRRHTAQGDSRESVRVEVTGEIFFEFDVVTTGMGRFGYVSAPHAAGAGRTPRRARMEDDERDEMLR